MPKLPSYTITDKAAIKQIEFILSRFPLDEDEPIEGSDAVDALAEIKEVLDATHFLPKKAGR